MIRIAFVGPIEPYRSGVARHTTALARAVSQRAATQVRVFSFSRQYPALLFPGLSDRASDATVPADLSVEYSIDSVDPRSWWRASEAIRAFRPDVVIAPMWTFFLAPCLSFILARLPCPVVAVVHNVVDHDASWWRSRVSVMQIKRASAYVTHTEELAASVRRLIPDANITVHHHPVFDYPAPVANLPKRAGLELLMFGLVRPYKGLDVLLEALARCRTKSLMLSVVGESWQSVDSLRSSIERLGIADRVELMLRYVSDREAAEYFARADVVLLPYRSVTGSGVLPLAYYYGKPVLASALPGFQELVVEGRNGWLVPPGDATALARALDERVCREAAELMRPAIDDTRRQLSFEHFAEALLRTVGQNDAPPVAPLE